MVERETDIKITHADDLATMNQKQEYKIQTDRGIILVTAFNEKEAKSIAIRDGYSVIE